MTSRSVEEIVCEEDKVADALPARVRSGTHDPGRADDRALDHDGTKIYHVRRGKIVQIAGHDPALGVLRQLGIADFEAS
jgi:ketosteroid isomerase-like protein